jgi:hypothetical protein
MSAPSAPTLGFTVKRYGKAPSTGSPVTKDSIIALFKNGDNFEDATSIDDLLQKLNKHSSRAVNEFLAIPEVNMSAAEFKRSFNEDWTTGSFVTLKRKLTEAQRKEDEAPLPWTEPQLSINNENLHIALLYPGIASYLKKVRSKVFNNSMAVRSPFFGGVPAGFAGLGGPYGSGIKLQLNGGGELNANYPIEMRGIGSLLAASMRGGAYPLALGTVNSPTIWRPITDDSFISESLKAAVVKLKAKLNAKGMHLDTNIEGKITDRLHELEKAEYRAKNLRDKLTKTANQFTGKGTNLKTEATGNGKDELSEPDVDRLVEEYNTAMNAVKKNEGVVLRVVDSLNNELFRYPPN